MKLSQKSKNELRKKIIEMVEKVPYGQRVHLDKELLEDLLFEVIVLDKEQGTVVKMPVWSGEFLRKIDLSEVDFTNVTWDILSCEEEDAEILFNNIVISDESVYRNNNAREKRENFLKRQVGYTVDYSWTNANIDLTKSFEAIHEQSIVISECNFTGVDLSQLDLTGIKGLYLVCSSIGKTNLLIPSNVDISGCESSFEGIDLSSRTIYASGYFDIAERADLPYCNLKSTGINIKLCEDELDKSKYDGAFYMAMIHCWVGCYLNGKKVLDEEPVANSSNQSEPTEQSFIDDVLSDLQGQVRRTRKYKSEGLMLE